MECQGATRCGQGSISGVSKAGEGLDVVATALCPRALSCWTLALDIVSARHAGGKLDHWACVVADDLCLEAQNFPAAFVFSVFWIGVVGSCCDVSLTTSPSLRTVLVAMPMTVTKTLVMLATDFITVEMGNPLRDAMRVRRP